MSRERLGHSALALAILLTCLAAGAAAQPAAPVVYVVSHGWHVGLVLQRDDLLALSPPPRLPVPPRRYVEVGWGDGEFYPAPKGTFSMALHAAFCSDFSVLHVAGFDGPVAQMFAGQDIVALELTPAGFAALARHVDASLAEPPDVVAPPIYGTGAFYRARGHYRLLDNSNTWAARGLRAAGCPMEVEKTVTAGAVLNQAARAGRCGDPG